jgi:hypothetical protein
LLKILVTNPEGKRPLGFIEDNIKIDLGEIALESMNWIHVPQVRDWWWAFVNTALNVQIS